MKQLQVIDLKKTYDNKLFAVDGISFEVQKGDFVILLGLSGSGKSTLLRCINRLIEPTAGDIVFEGRSIRDLSTAQLRRYRRHIAMVFQQFN
ncbi:MAG: ATP-binding cassette domain-containing protein, partial [Candidatus Cloacimonadaceae bacterium]|nr:ATP-binding cassette domain-containing protein [Candidatus Cloacimonadaceae bacterium]